MKRFVLAIAAMMITTAGMAQEKKDVQRQPKMPTPTEMAQKRTDDMVKKYGLTEAQGKKLLALNQKYADKMKPGNGPGGPHHHHGKPGMKPPQKDGKDRPQKGDSIHGKRPQRPPMTDEQRQQMEKERQAHETTRKAYEAELSKILTADQLKAYQADMKKHGPKGPRGPRPDKDAKKK